MKYAPSDQLYDSPKFDANVTSHTFACQNIVWGSEPSPVYGFIARVMMTYEDHYGASYVVMYERSW
ncbi:MAG: hypothetical protein KBF73_11850 [Flavobacteriales bacterium]|nr:hypothetical protein [Flavobacteriales bacterium]